MDRDHDSLIRSIRSILIANRGEIACRIIASCKKLGIRSIAVYSAVDRQSPHVILADEAYPIGENAASSSYLRGDVIIETALRAGADAIHPGYGFLSENAAFAKQVTEAGILFIGPGLEAITKMGDKLMAKETVSGYDIPMVPGTDRALENIAEARAAIEKIGLPVLVKASAGGGGKGMRMVSSLDDLDQQIERAMSEARSAFGNGAVFIEKYVTQPRHIEIQVLADQQGNIVHLYERECSIQRRHQKVIEEAPSAVLSPELRAEMGAAAVRVARSCNYIGAGTVEFLLSGSGEFYFLEMNTRLQVEHPVTELITGIDLVEQQIRIAEGHPLEIRQEDIPLQGHAIELRVYAEDPTDDWAPSIGTIERWQFPEGENIRLDTGFREGMEVPIYYDPMLAKLIVWAPTRALAIRKMYTVLEQSQIRGISTTLPFGAYVMADPVFQSGQYDTHYVKDHFRPDNLYHHAETRIEDIARIAAELYSR